jgi:pyruvate/2-oxoglutarate dehydrogenase complex dihydrolipoamide dehydrogenase (E3) component
MTGAKYDLAIIGAGAGGLTAAAFAKQLGAKVALVEKARIGGDCTWTGCVPSKALIKVARVVHEMQKATLFGIASTPPVVDMVQVRDYLRNAINHIYQSHTPEALAAKGIDILRGAARFINPNTLEIEGRRVGAGKFLITTGAVPKLPAIVGLSSVPYFTYERIFENDRLPRSMVVVGGGPQGMEIAQAYQRLGAQVTIVAEKLLPRDELEAVQLLQEVLEREGVHFVTGRVESVRRTGTDFVVATAREQVACDLLFMACGRKPVVEGLGLDAAGVRYTTEGIQVDNQLRTSNPHIYAAGDVLGELQFSHLAGWQAFLAARNALLPGSSKGRTALVPWVTFTDPEVAHVGLTERQVRERYGEDITIGRWAMNATDRAVCDDDTDGFIKVIARKNGTILGATIVSHRAGESITEFIMAINQGMKVKDLAGPIHAYPTYSTVIQQLAAQMVLERMLAGLGGKAIRWLLAITRGTPTGKRGAAL